MKDCCKTGTENEKKKVALKNGSIMRFMEL